MHPKAITMTEGMFGPGVYGFFGEFRWLSNFEPALIYIGDRMFKSTEHYYQACKSRDPKIFDQIADAETCGLAKKFGQSVSRGGLITPDNYDSEWDHPLHPRKDIVMMQALEAKYRIPVYGEKLQRLKGLYLEETNWWKDTYWGVCEGKGLNKLGLFTMKVRDNGIS